MFLLRCLWCETKFGLNRRIVSVDRVVRREKEKSCREKPPENRWPISHRRPELRAPGGRAWPASPAHDGSQEPACEPWPTRPDPKDTAFDLLGDVLSDVSNKNEDSEHFDQYLLKSLAAFRHVLNGSYQQMLVSGRRYSLEAPAVMDKSTIDSAGKLHSKTLPPSRGRLVDVLDAVQISNRTFAMKLDDGQEVRGIFGKDDFDGVLELLRAKQRVLVRGKAFFKP
jgi:hypothetical protein